MNRYLISDQRLLGSSSALVDLIARRASAGVSMVQIREKDLSARQLAALVQDVLAHAGSARVLVNSRVDVALACGAHGAHLPAGSPPPAAWRGITPQGFLFGVSCHSIAELAAALEGGADFAVYGPVFRPLSKDDARPPVELAGLAEACRAVRLPVYALGGVTAANAADCIRAGAAGIAGISLFLDPP